MPENIVPFTLPKKPRVKQKEAPPDQRKLAVIPIRAGTDERLHGATLRCLIVLCSYCNRAGLTWVGQAKLAEHLNVSRQAVTKQMKLLAEHGYIEVVKKGWRGERANTIRVIFDQSVDVDTAIAITNPIEDTRPPSMQDEQPDPEGQRRVAQLIAKALKQPTKPKEFTMPKSGETRAVRQVKEAMQKAQAKRSHKQPTEVANEDITQVANEAVDNHAHRQPDRQPSEVAQTQKEHSNRQPISNLNESYLKVKSCLGNFEVEELKGQGLTDAQIADALDVLLPAYQAEGLTPTSRVLADSILQLSRDVA